MSKALYLLRLTRTRLRAVFRKNIVERELEEELRFHVRMRAQENERRGMPVAEAQQAALRSFGSFIRVREAARDVKGGGMIETVISDLQFGVRMLRKNPGFTAVAILTLALGIGANTALFSVINAVLLEPLPLREPERLINLYETFKPAGTSAISVPNLRDWQQQNSVFAGIAAYSDGAFNLQAGDNPQRLKALFVQANYFEVLGIKPQLGRTFLKGEDEPGREQVIILSDPLWRNTFGEDPEIINKVIPLNGQKYTVVGVMPASLSALSRSQIWAPLVFPEGQTVARGGHDYLAIARLKSEVTLEQASEQMTLIAARLEQQYPDVQAGRGAHLIRYEDELVGDVKQSLWMLMGAVGFVLLIACTNVANLLLARAAGRHREIGMRMALGAGRLRLVRQFLTEGLLLSVAGGVAGVAMASLALRTLVFGFLPRASEIKLDSRVLLFSLCISIFTGLIFGLTPAIQALKTNLQQALIDGGKGTARGFGGNWVRNGLVIAEISAAFVLLIGAGLLIKSFAKLQAVDTGLRPENVLTAKLSLPEGTYPDSDSMRRFYRQVDERVGALPGVESAGVTSHLAVEQYGTNGYVPVEGKTYARNHEPLVELRVVSPDYFRAMGVPLIRGRMFDDRDTKDSPPGVLINETMARTIWPGEDPIGKRVLGRPIVAGWVPVVGVVGDIKNKGLTRPPASEFYFNYMHAGEGILRNMTLTIRSRLEPSSLASMVRREIQTVDAAQPIYDVRTMQDVLDETVSARRINMTLLGGLAAVSLALALVGIYGVMSYNVTRNTRDIGIRMALGAQKIDIHRLVLSRGASLALAGVSIGLVTALAVTRVMSGLLFGVSTTDPVTFVGIAVLLFGVAVAACYIPARRAVRVDPLIALRFE